MRAGLINFAGKILKFQWYRFAQFDFQPLLKTEVLIEIFWGNVYVIFPHQVVCKINCLMNPDTTMA
jgi:hypothetical protein